MQEAHAFGGLLLSRAYLSRLADSGDAPAAGATEARAFAGLWRRASEIRAGGSIRALGDVFAKPLAAVLGFTPGGFRVQQDCGICAVLGVDDQAVALMWVTSDRFERARARATAATASAGFRWALAFDGEDLALVDCARPHARRFLVARTAACAQDTRALRVLMAVFGARTLKPDVGGRSQLELMIARSEAELRGVRTALQDGVERAALTLADALSRRTDRTKPSTARLFEEALTVVYRVLFLQFAEARGLVPVWHPTYRHGYTVEALREQIEAGGVVPGAWDALQAMSRLAHRGARAGALVVVPFNGRLFSPSHAPEVATRTIPDADATAAIAALTLAPAAEGRPQRIPFADLDVEQLGSIYERVLDFTPEPDPASGHTVLRRGTARKTTGSFYTPRSLTELVVRRTLRPLVEGRRPDDILQLRVLDPAMGSGAFLVAACRYLAGAYETALQEAGFAGAEDFSARDRAGFRRLVAQHCLFGVDVNPMAVQLGRLSLWLSSLASDKPLTFLDHRLRVGNSILGTTPQHVTMRAPGGRSIARPATLFDDSALDPVGRAIDLRLTLDAIPDDTLDDVQRKEALCAELDARDGPLSGWRAVCDAWCAAWFWPAAERPGPNEFGAICAAARGDKAFSHSSVDAALRQADALAREHRFFHWPLEFPEVLLRGGQGFDAIVGNPPWEMVRGYEGTRQLLRFTRDSGVYRLQSAGHGNAYQLFVERALQLVSPRGRVGMVLPWGAMADEGSAALRGALFDRCDVDELLPIDNAAAVFPIHRALKFVALSATAGASTERLRLRAAVRELTELDRIDGPGLEAPAQPIELRLDLLRRLSGGTMAVPHVGSAEDVRILEFLIASAPAAADPSGWGLRFGRELNATDDRDVLSEGDHGYPVIAGRHLRPFTVAIDHATLRVGAAEAAERVGDLVLRQRLAYRDVAGAGNRMTLIAAIVPPRVVTTHTVFCLKTRLPADDQLFVCAVLNSFVANYFVRARVGTHVTTGIIGTLPLPRPARGSASYADIVRCARQLCADPVRADAMTRLNVAVAALYGLDGGMLERILATFPLVPAAQRDAVLAAFRDLRAI